MHLATLMHNRLCHLLYSHVICIVGVVKGGEILSRGGPPPPLRPLHWLKLIQLTKLSIAGRKSELDLKLDTLLDTSVMLSCLGQRVCGISEAFSPAEWLRALPLQARDH